MELYWYDSVNYEGEFNQGGRFDRATFFLINTEVPCTNLYIRALGSVAEGDIMKVLDLSQCPHHL